MLGDAAAGRWPVPASAVGTPSAATTSAAAMRIFFTFSPYVVVCVSWYVSRYCTALVQLLSRVYPSSCVPLQRREAPTDPRELAATLSADRVYPRLREQAPIGGS